MVPSAGATVSQSMHVSYACCHPVVPLIHSTQHALNLSATCVRVTPASLLGFPRRRV